MLVAYKHSVTNRYMYHEHSGHLISSLMYIFLDEYSCSKGVVALPEQHSLSFQYYPVELRRRGLWVEWRGFVRFIGVGLWG